MIKNCLSLLLRRLKVFLTRQPEQVEVCNGTNTAEVISELEEEIIDLRRQLRRKDSELVRTIKEFGSVLDAQKTKEAIQMDILSGTIEHLTQALSHTSVHFKTVERKKKALPT